MIIFVLIILVSIIGFIYATKHKDTIIAFVAGGLFALSVYSLMVTWG